jgi:hypothetical protein
MAQGLQRLTDCADLVQNIEFIRWGIRADGLVQDDDV